MKKYLFIVLLVNTYYVKAITIITTDSQTHVDYGLSYPITYEFLIPNNSQKFIRI